MTYRDEVEALKAKLDEAERENEALRTENAALRRGITPRVVDTGKVLGAPTRIRIERTFHGELDPKEHTRLAALVRSMHGVRGSTISLGKTLIVRTRWQREARAFELRITSKDGKTTITLDERLGQLAGGILGGVGGGVGIGGLAGIVTAVATTLGAGAALVAAPLWLLVSLGFARGLYGTIVERRQAQHLELVQKLGEAVQAAIDERRPASAARVRVEPTDAEPDADEQSEPAEANRVASAAKRS